MEDITTTAALPQHNQSLSKQQISAISKLLSLPSACCRCNSSCEFNRQPCSLAPIPFTIKKCGNKYIVTFTGNYSNYLYITIKDNSNEKDKIKSPANVLSNSFSYEFTEISGGATQNILFSFYDNNGCNYNLTVELSIPVSNDIIKFCQGNDIYIDPKSKYKFNNYILQSHPSNSRVDYWNTLTSVCCGGITGPISHSLPPGKYSITHIDQNGCILEILNLEIIKDVPVIYSCVSNITVNCGSIINLKDKLTEINCCGNSVNETTVWTNVNNIPVFTGYLFTANQNITLKTTIIEDCQICEVTINITIQNPTIPTINIYIPASQNPNCCKSYDYFYLYNIFSTYINNCNIMPGYFKVESSTSPANPIYINNPSPMQPPAIFTLCPNIQYTVTMGPAINCCKLKIRVYCTQTPNEFITVVNDPIYPGITTHINDPQSTSSEFNIFPNPSSGIFNIRWAGKNTSGDYSMELFDLNGKSIPFNTEQPEIINLNGYAAGIYTLKITLNEKVQIFKLIKQ